MGTQAQLPVSEGERRLIRVWRWIRGQFGRVSPILFVVGAILIGFGYENRVQFWLGVVASVIAALLELWLGPRYARLIDSERLSNARATERASAIQKILYAGLRAMMDTLSVDFSQARVSIYRHKGDHFIMLARDSDSLRLKEPGRVRYPDTQGIIHRAWDNEEAVATNLPADRTEWEQRCASEYDMDIDDLRSMSMQALSVVGKRIDLTVGSGTRPIGLIVFESLTPRGVNGRTLDKVNRSSTYPLLEQILVEAIACLDERDVEDFRSLGVASQEAKRGLARLRRYLRERLRSTTA